MKIIDTHTHIDYITCDLQPGVVGVVCCATEESDWNKIVHLMVKNDCVYGAFGIHPWNIESVKDDVIIRLKKLLESNENYMVGEIGLDKHKPNMDKQLDFFVKQFDVAVHLKRIVFLHCVGAWDKILHILKQYKQSELPVIVAHNFNENQDIIDKLLKYENIMFSIGKNAVYGKNCRIDKIPLERIFVETDGKPDVMLKDVIAKIVDVKHDENVPNIIYNNTQRILKK